MTTRRCFLWLTGASGVGLCLAEGLIVERRAPMRVQSTGACSFCGQSRGEVAAIIGVPGREERICDECLGMCTDLISHPRTRFEYASRFTCSFCDRPYRDASHLISGPRVFICDNCTRNSLSALAEMTPDQERSLRVRYGIS